MSFAEFMTDKVALLKQSGERREDITASVQRKKIFIDDASLIIELGDPLERIASNGLLETYEVVDPVLYEASGEGCRTRRGLLSHI